MQSTFWYFLHMNKKKEFTQNFTTFKSYEKQYNFLNLLFYKILKK